MDYRTDYYILKKINKINKNKINTDLKIKDNKKKKFVIDVIYNNDKIILINNNLFNNLYNYNPCIVNDNTKLRLFYRVCYSKNFSLTNSIIKTVLLNTELIPINNTNIKLKIKIKNNFNNCEDPRAVFFNNFWFIVYTNGYYTFVAKLNKNMFTIYSHELIKPKNIIFHNTDGREKNWIPCIMNNKLYIIYSSNPNIIFEMEDKLSELIIKNIIIKDKIIKCNYGVIRGGAPPIKYNDLYDITFFHTRHHEIFYIGALLTDNLFNTIAITRIPIIKGNPVFFVCGAININDGWKISIGINDRNLGYLDISKDTLDPFFDYDL